MGFSVRSSCLGCRNKIAFAFFELHSVRITHFVEDFHTAILGFGAAALFVHFARVAVVKNARILNREIRQIRENVLFLSFGSPKAFGVRVFRVVRGSQSASFWLRLRRAVTFAVKSVSRQFA
jgi:hypothetical protein